MQETATKLLQDKVPGLLPLGDALVDAILFRGELTVTLNPEKIRDAILLLKKDFSMMMDLFAMDYMKFPEETPSRFAVIYNLYAPATKGRVFLKVWLSEESPKIASIHDLYSAANWFEREAWDLFGIEFAGHPNLVRILCHNEFVGHALRKDYPSDQYQRLKRATTSAEF